MFNNRNSAATSEESGQTLSQVLVASHTAYYAEKYPKLRPDLIEHAVRVIQSHIKSDFNPTYNRSNVSSRFSMRLIRDIQLIENIYKEFDKEIDKKKVIKPSHALKKLYSFKTIKGAETLFRDQKTPPTNPEDYLPLIRDVTKEIGTLVTNTIESNLPPLLKPSNKSGDNRKTLGDVTNTPSPSSSESSSPIAESDKFQKKRRNEDRDDENSKRPKPSFNSPSASNVQGNSSELYCS